ncbi:MAG: hypothetical protein ABI866_09475 [Dokdonella sp.]
MALDISGLTFIGAIIDSICWLFSPTFRARKRADWQREGARSRIAEVGMWFVIWLSAIGMATVTTAVWLSQPDTDTATNAEIHGSIVE